MEPRSSSSWDTPIDFTPAVPDSGSFAFTPSDKEDYRDVSWTMKRWGVDPSASRDGWRRGGLTGGASPGKLRKANAKGARCDSG